MATWEELRPSLDVPYVVALAPEAWKETFKKRPTDEVAIGMHTLSAHDVDKCRNEARKWAQKELGGATIEAKIESLKLRYQAWAISLACCDPNNIDRLYFASGDDQVLRELRPEGVRRLYDELETLHLGESVALPVASDEDCLTLALLLADPARTLARLDPQKETFCRRLLRTVLDEVVKAGPALAPGEDGAAESPESLEPLEPEPVPEDLPLG